jgi:5-methylcytosine-specific restriction endonuclease McrA
MGKKNGIDPYEGYRTLLRNWDGLCILCGEPFDNMESITREHLVLHSKGGRGSSNLAPSHFACNQVRGDLPLVEAMILVRAKKQRLGKDFKRWCNKSVPNRRPIKKAQPDVQEEQKAIEGREVSQ